MPNSYTSLKVHVIFCTLQRLPLITEELETELYRFIGGVIAKKRGVLIEINGMPDHVHLLASLRPDVALSEMVQRIKGNSSRWITAHDLTEDLFGWQAGYAAFSVSESQVPTVRRYIRRQKQHHRRYTVDHELDQFRDRHNLQD
ncbi:MAG: IS200/IS605 family transposase [bacterium]|nr:IS200/IS605 family transposase [bacterium]